jgi:hypothetical protein
MNNVYIGAVLKVLNCKHADLGDLIVQAANHPHIRPVGEIGPTHIRCVVGCKTDVRFVSDIPEHYKMLESDISIEDLDTAIPEFVFQFTTHPDVNKFLGWLTHNGYEYVVYGGVVHLEEF